MVTEEAEKQPASASSSDNNRSLVTFVRRGLYVLSLLYIAGFVGWLAAYHLLGDRWWWLFAVNSLVLYLFLPAPLLLPLAILLRRPALAAGFLLTAVTWAFLWGPLFWPGSAPNSDGPSLRVMTYNAFGFNPTPDEAVRAIQAGDPDVVGLLELSPEVADALRTQLSSTYPYQQFDPDVGVLGAGIISKLPFRASDDRIDDPDWLGAPAIIELDLQGELVTVVLFHASSGPCCNEMRERQARKLARYAEDHARPLIVMGDLNASSTNRAYQIVTGQLTDAWRAQGSGFGHTFPFDHAPTPFGITSPKRLLRIDFVFYSQAWSAISTEVGSSAGGSDHAPVVAELVLRR